MSKTTFRFSVFVDNNPLKEYEIVDETYIEANLHAKSSYIIKEIDDDGYTQNYPVTPYEIRGWFRNSMRNPCYLKLCIDGQQIWMKPFAPDYEEQYFKVSGIKDQRRGSITELLFSLPKITSQKDKSSKLWTENLGTITMECLEAIEDGYYQTRRKEFRQNRHPTSLSDDPTHYQATKQDCSKKGGIGVSTREGRGIGRFNFTNNVITMMRYKLGRKTFGKITLNYRPRHVLEELGVIDKSWISNGIEKSQQKKTNAQEEKSSNKQKKSPTTQENVDKSIGIKKEILSSTLDEKENSLPLSTKMAPVTDQKEVLTENNKSKDIKRELIGAEIMYNERVENVMAKLKDLGCSTPSQPNSKKLYCYSPSIVEVKREQIERTDIGNIKLGCHSPSGVNKGLFSGKLGCQSPSDIMGQQVMYPSQIKREVIDDEDKQFRYIEIDDDLIMLQEIDDDLVWMGDESCCFIDVEPEEIPIIDLA